MTLMTEIYRLRRTHAANFFRGQSSTCHSFEVFLTEMQSNVCHLALVYSYTLANCRTSQQKHRVTLVVIEIIMDFEHSMSLIIYVSDRIRLIYVL